MDKSRVNDKNGVKIARNNLRYIFHKSRYRRRELCAINAAGGAHGAFNSNRSALAKQFV